jgi:hypothetical protein
MHPDEIYTRLGSIISGKDLTGLDYNESNPELFKAWDSSINEILKRNLTICKARGIDLSTAKSRIMGAIENGAEIIIIDYKTSKEINEFSKYRKRMLAPISFLQECELTTYSIQLNLYKLLLERNTNLKIGGCYLIHIHEEQQGYALIECKEYQNVVELMINDYLKHKK